MKLRQWLNATPLASSIARKIISDAHPEPLHTHRIFALSQNVALTPEQQQEEITRNTRLARRSGSWLPPNSSHPIRSIKYLKTVVLEDLATRGEIVKITHKRPATSEELKLAALARPPALPQPKNRGDVGPGKRPVRPQGDFVVEWVWRLKTPEDVERERLEKVVEREKHELKIKLKAEARIKAIRLKAERRRASLFQKRLEMEHRASLRSKRT